MWYSKATTANPVLFENTVLHYFQQIVTTRSDFFTNQNARKLFGDQTPPGPAAEAYSIPWDTLAGFKGPLYGKKTGKMKQR